MESQTAWSDFLSVRFHRRWNGPPATAATRHRCQATGYRSGQASRLRTSVTNVPGQHTYVRLSSDARVFGP
ncbi:hypothetical protein GCM10028832_41790 [Streptomyces sparsus]